MRWEALAAEKQASQRGLITFRQLSALQVSSQTVRRAASDGRLMRVRRGVYAHPSLEITYEHEVLAVLLAVGGHAFGSHFSSGRMWEASFARDATLLEATTLLDHQPRLPGVRLHRSGLLRDPDVTRLRGIWVTTPERTLCDLSSRLDPQTLGRAVDDFMRRRLTTYGRIYHLALRLPSAPGRSQAKMLRVLLARGPEADKRESDLEDYVYDSLRRYGIPLPVPQHPVELKGRMRRIDHCYPDARLAIEAAGFAYHGMRDRFDDDALRGNELELAEFRLLVFTSAFDDWTIASQVAQALGLKQPVKPADVLTYTQWQRQRDRLCEKGA